MRRTHCRWEPANWQEITFSKYNEDYAHPSRAKRNREWRKDQGVA